jgi:hypothetical protein
VEQGKTDSLLTIAAVVVLVLLRFQPFIFQLQLTQSTLGHPEQKLHKDLRHA